MNDTLASGTLVVLLVPAELDTLTSGMTVQFSWRVTDHDDKYAWPVTRWAEGSVVRLSQLSVTGNERLTAPTVVDDELHVDRQDTARSERLAHVPQCEHHIPKTAWCEECQRDWEGE